MRRRVILLALAVAPPAFAALALPAPAGAHSLPDVEGRLHDRERFFQPLEARPAPDFALQDAEGRPVRLADLRGKVVVLHFVYASCPDVCPLHAELIARVQGMVNLTPMRDQVRFVTVTTDPERDTPEVLRGYGEARGLDPANWTFLTSGAARPEEGRRLAEAYGLRFVPTPEGMQMHAVVTHVVDREGRLRAKFHGLDFDPTNLVVYLNALTHDEEGGGHVPPPRPAPGVWERLRGLF
ncbi:cytochrome-c oxidase [Caldovatus sediminis]|uniref:Cytochrome-c oxidase n=1 Tax=Caldovatus sediminis TaxID=2041189 RepID=A0A8J2ZFA8_9PROT|nr:SCO family protein [Caldovatus sediminis]GGG52449.1 cytochrome-c oxidase [Caldovatus sediminis]